MIPRIKKMAIERVTAPMTKAPEGAPREQANDGRPRSTDHLGFPDAEAKVISTLCAQYALAGLELIAEIGIDGVTRLHTVYQGKFVPLGCVDCARVFLAQIGGSHA